MELWVKVKKKVIISKEKKSKFYNFKLGKVIRKKYKFT